MIQITKVTVAEGHRAGIARRGGRARATGDLLRQSEAALRQYNFWCEAVSGIRKPAPTEFEYVGPDGAIGWVEARGGPSAMSV